MTTGSLHRLAAFTTRPDGGDPAGVWVGDTLPDPATMQRAAELGGYLRAAGLVKAPATLVVRQGEAMGRPSRLVVDIPAAGGIIVTGTAVPIRPTPWEELSGTSS